MDLIRPTHAEVDLDAIAHNVRELRRFAPNSHFMAVVKANGYGHGAVPVAEAALAAGATWLGVATLEEGVELRRAGLTAPTLVFGYIPPAEAGTVLAHDLRAACFSLDFAQALSAVAKETPARVHMKVDTGMGRIGVRPEDAVAFAQAVSALPGVELEGVFTHLATADEPEHDFAARQLQTFDQTLSELQRAGITPKVRHACNSAGIMLHPRGHYDLVRGGIALYGLAPDPAVKWPADLRPALTWRTAIGFAKTVSAGTPISYGRTYYAEAGERIASLPVGYADGLFRLLTNKGEVLVGGQRCPIVGRVCMDQTMVRLPADLPAAPGDEVILIGRQGAEEITAADMAQTALTINYEVVCAISRRVPRIYRRDGQVQK